jgi:hypothetical protein
MLNDEQRARYQRDGYLVLPGFKSEQQIAAVRTRAGQIVDDFDPGKGAGISLGNGCLWVQPGGHRGPLRERFVRDGDQVRMEKLDDTPWPDDSVAVPVEVAAGTLVCFHGLLPHYSAPNRSAASRHAYTLHATDGGTAYSPHNWIQRDARFPVRGFD